MNIGLYQSASSLTALERWQDAVAQNITSAQNTGFRKRTVQFSTETAGEWNLAAGARTGEGGLPAIFPKTSGGINFLTGETQPTRRELDVAIQGDGFFEVQRADGTIAYTRDGSFKLNAQGQVVTVDGLPILSGFQPVPPGTESITIAEDGNVTLQSSGGAQTFRLTLTRFANPAGLRSLGGNMYEETAASGTPEAGNAGEQGFGRTIQGYVETSNVNIVEEMVNLIIAQRAYEINSKSIQTSDEMLQNIANLKR